MNARTLAATTLALVAALPATAQAHEPVFQDESVALDGLLYEAVRKADEFWRSLGHDPGEALIYMTSRPDADGAASLPGHKVWFQRQEVRRIRHRIASRDRDRRRWAYEDLFLTAAHERGHNLGFNHSDGGIMADTANAIERLPGIGLDWAREKAR